MSAEEASRWALYACALGSLALALVCARLAWRALGPLRSVMTRDARVLEGTVTLVASSEPFPAAFTARPVVYERARLRGPDAVTGAERVVWERTTHVPAVLTRAGHEPVPIVWESALVLTPTAVRRAAVRVLAHEIPAVTRRLRRSGYEKPPKGDALFQLEEDVVFAGETVRLVPRESDGRAVITSLPAFALVLRAGRVALLTAGVAIAVLLQSVLALLAAAVLR